jgi:predicted nuclease of predicted toxin-antitoxin system
MNILFDQGVPAPLRDHLHDHSVATAFERGWSTLTNGQLLDAAEAAGFALMITTDRHLKDQQNLAARTIAIIVLRSTSWPRIQRCVDAIVEAIAHVRPGEYREIAI